MKLSTEYREETVGVLKGTKDHYLVCHVEFSDEERAVIQERGLYSQFITLPADRGLPTRMGAYGLRAIKVIGMIIAPIGLLISCAIATSPSTYGADGTIAFLALVVGIGLFVYAQYTERKNQKLMDNPEQTITIGSLLTKPDFLVHAYAPAQAQVYEEEIRTIFQSLASTIRDSAPALEKTPMNFKVTFPEDPLAAIIVLIGLFVVAVFALFFALVVVVPTVLITIGAVLFYRYYRLQQMKAKDKLPATIKDRPHYQTLGEFSELVKSNKLLTAAEEETELYSCQSLADAFVRIITELYADESFHEPPPRPETTDRITIGRYYDELEAWQRKVSDDSNLDVFLNTVAGAYIDLRSYFPHYALQSDPEPRTSSLTTALRLSDDEADGKALIGWFFDTEVKKRKLFERLRDQIQANDEAGDDISFNTHFAKTPFRALTRVSVPIQLPDETRFAGTWICAPQGMGKTTLLHVLIAGDLEKDASIILMDSKGDLIEPFLSHPMLADRRVIVGPDNPVGLNPLDIPHTDINKAVESLEYLFSSLVDFKLTGTQSMLLKAVLRSLITVFPNPTLTTFQELLAPHGEKKFAEQIKLLEPDLQAFFGNEFNTENIRALRQEVLQRLRSLLDHDLLRSMFLAPKTTFRIGECHGPGRRHHHQQFARQARQQESGVFRQVLRGASARRRAGAQLPRSG